MGVPSKGSLEWALFRKEHFSLLYRNSNITFSVKIYNEKQSALIDVYKICLMEIFCPTVYELQDPENTVWQ